MDMTRLEGTNLRVTDIALGTGALGSRFDDKTSLDILDCYIGCGGNFIDTANVYGRWNPGNKPLSEQLLGRWMRLHRLRDKIVLATKGSADAVDAPGVKRLAPEQIRGDLEDSLLNLKTDYIDLYYLHQDDPLRDVGEIIETLNELEREGKIRYFACSNWTASRMCEADAYARKHKLKTFAAHEIMFNMAKPNDDAVEAAIQSHMTDDIFTYHEETGRPVTAYTSQAAGFFVLCHEPGFVTDEKYEFPRSMFYNQESIERAGRVEKLCALCNASALELTLAYLYAQPFQVIPIIGPWNVGELKESLHASQKRINARELKFLLNAERY